MLVSMRPCIPSSASPISILLSSWTPVYRSLSDIILCISGAAPVGVRGIVYGSPCTKEVSRFWLSSIVKSPVCSLLTLFTLVEFKLFCGNVDRTLLAMAALIIIKFWLRLPVFIEFSKFMLESIWDLRWVALLNAVKVLWSVILEREFDLLISSTYEVTPKFSFILSLISYSARAFLNSSFSRSWPPIFSMSYSCSMILTACWSSKPWASSRSSSICMRVCSRLRAVCSKTSRSLCTWFSSSVRYCSNFSRSSIVLAALFAISRSLMSTRLAERPWVAVDWRNCKLLIMACWFLTSPCKPWILEPWRAFASYARYNWSSLNFRSCSRRTTSSCSRFQSSFISITCSYIWAELSSS